MARNQHVTPHPNGGWQVKAAGNEVTRGGLISTYSITYGFN